ncbi:MULTISPECIES: macrolide family glycosyltransferase [Sorangium]|uniref:macrolide family glycosyltransferase n=1 Tax=Sorangium TaxID=39643 RepID=UPI003D9C2807
MKTAFLSFPESGHVNPTIGLVRELVRSGFDVHYYTGARFEGLISSTGARFKDYGMTLPTLDQSENLVHSTNIMLECGEILYERMRGELAELKPDLIIHDGVCGWAKCIAAALGVPAVSSISSFAMNESILRGLNSLPETVKFFARLFLSRHGKRFFALVGRQNERLKASGLPVPARGLDLVEFSTSPEKLNIVYSTRAWQPQGSSFDNSYKFIGPTIAPRGEEAFDHEKQENKPLVYVSMGTILNRDVNLYRTCFQALGDLDVSVILSAGKGADLLKGQEIPGNFRVYSHVPQIEVLKMADLFVSQGGLNSVNEAMFFEVPMVVVPVTGEQTLNARRVSEAGAGILLKKLGASTLRSAVERILRDPSYRRSCSTVSSDFKSAGGPAMAVQAIVDYLGGSERVRSIAQEALPERAA